MAKIGSTLLDNSPNFEMVEKIKQLVKEEDVNEILIATGYWDIPGTALIANELSEFLSKDGKSIKLLIGKDPTVFASQLTEIGCTDIKNTSDAIKINLSNLKPREEYLPAVRLLQCYCEGESPKFSIHTFTNPEDTRQFFHSKCYIFTESAFTANNTDHGLYAIVGSSNFTQKGLEDNSELNYLEIQSQVIDARNNNRQKGHIEWFKEKWNSTRYPSWKKYRFNIIDTPGHVDFTIEVQRSLRVLDGAVLLLDSQAGVEPQSETVWRQANEYKVPRIIFSNKMDKMGADFYMSLNSVKDRLGANCAAIELPIGAESEFRGVIDLVTMKAYEFDGGTEENAIEIEIPEDMKAKAEEYRNILIEAAADFDEELMMTYLDGGEVSVEALKATLLGIRNEEAKQLLDFAFANFEIDSLADENTPVMKTSISKSINKEYDVYTDNITILKEKGTKKEYDKVIEMSNLQAPIEADTVIGKIKYYEKNSPENIIKENDIYVKEKILKSNFMDYFTYIISVFSTF